MIAGCRPVDAGSALPRDRFDVSDWRPVQATAGYLDRVTNKHHDRHPN